MPHQTQPYPVGDAFVPLDIPTTPDDASSPVSGTERGASKSYTICVDGPEGRRGRPQAFRLNYAPSVTS